MATESDPTDAQILEAAKRALRPTLCGKYLGDNDATCPQLTCIRQHGHDGLCDNVNGDPMVMDMHPLVLTRLIERARAAEKRVAELELAIREWIGHVKDSLSR